MLLITLAFFATALHLLGHYRGPRWLVYVFKPLATALLIVVALSAQAVESRYRTAVVVGLLFSLAGDVFLMLPKDRFIAGLVSFLLAHIAYLIAFTTGVGFGSRPLLLLPYLAVAGAVMAYLWPALGDLRLPVIVYVTALVLMAWQAASASVPAAIGGILFIVSDATLAIDRFRKPFRAAQAVVMITYIASQALIAYSVRA